MEELARFQRIDTRKIQRIEELEELPWSWDLNFELLSDFASYLATYEIEEGQVLFTEGDNSAFLVFLIKGTIEIRKHSFQDDVLVVRLQEGTVFGEMPLLDGLARSASAIVRQRSIVYLLTREKFFTMKKEHPRLALMITLKLAKVISQRLRITTGEWVGLKN